MQGAASWAQITFIIGVAGAAALMGFLFAWRYLLLRSQDRHDLRVAFEQRTTMLDERINDIRDMAEKRISSIENYNAGAMVVLKHLEEFRREVAEQLKELHKQRSSDMQQINTQLNAMKNLERLNRGSMRGDAM